MIERFGDYQKGIIYCTQCGNPNRIENHYCDSCGVNLTENSLCEIPVEQPSIRIIALHEPQYASAFQHNHSSSITPIKLHPQNIQEVTPEGIVGLIIGIFSLFILLFLRIFPNISHIIVLVLSVLTIIGLILSGLSIKKHKILGTTGLIINVIGLLLYRYIIPILFYFVF